MLELKVIPYPNGSIATKTGYKLLAQSCSLRWLAQNMPSKALKFLLHFLRSVWASIAVEKAKVPLFFFFVELHHLDPAEYSRHQR
ncbi:unnamed protein product [Haemonchus placei]|uniref:Uncharacterized protein n=1 Tax=Haemonchus placei TaxID=6290 RepID=A0A0N4X5K9_HAEPC|nr:unnamed protein product [Haemonchus placei]